MSVVGLNLGLASLVRESQTFYNLFIKLTPTISTKDAKPREVINSSSLFFLEGGGEDFSAV